MIALLAATLLALSPEGESEQWPSSAKGDLSGLVTADDYPLEAIERGAEGDVRVKLAIGPDGKVTDCTVIKSAGDASLDRTTCAILTARAKFEPARDSRGRPVADTYTAPAIVWMLENSGPFVPLQDVWIMHVDADGLSHCTSFINDSAKLMLTREECLTHLSPQWISHLGSLAGAGSITTVSTLTPAGQQPRPLADYGELVTHVEADVVIASNGEPRECRIRPSEDTRLNPRTGAAEVCATFFQEMRFDPVEGGLQRGAVLTESLYYDMDAGQ